MITLCKNLHSFVEATFTVRLVSSRQPQSLQDALPASAAAKLTKESKHELYYDSTPFRGAVHRAEAVCVPLFFCSSATMIRF
jgi:hypothetical protein